MQRSSPPLDMYGEQEAMDCEGMAHLAAPQAEDWEWHTFSFELNGAFSFSLTHLGYGSLAS